SRVIWAFPGFEGKKYSMQPSHGASGGRAPSPLDPVAADRLRTQAARIACSVTWADAIESAVRSGLIPYKSDVCAVLRRTGFYPPAPGTLDRSPVARPMRPCQSRLCSGRLYPAHYITITTTRRGDRLP